ncbi:hypothetical protein QAD02_012704 [Eretmocerus hayati]|uniref:Uncharacterized protein n=1 Tax=Eretmocerus hayati TaxID=131215 RepID=A0ACC2P3A8_9HYME|nr:hypothetical protein QAD02_012704 [Eretmocerus hayati]
MITIQVASENAEAISFDLSGLKFPLKSLQIFFPAAVGLQYLKNGKVDVTLNEGGVLKLVPYIKTYKFSTNDDFQNDDELYLRSKVQWLYKSRYYYEEIVALLRAQDVINISLRQLKRLLESMGLRRSYLLDAITEHGCIPSKARIDRGTENQVIEVIMRVLRQQNDDEEKHNCFLKGKSTANECIEKYWKQLRNSTLGFYIDLFKTMEIEGILDRSDMSHIEILRYCFGGVIRDDLKRSSIEWNEHRMGKQKGIRAPSGIPNIMYYCPQLSGGVDCRKTVNLRSVEKIRTRLAEKPTLFKKSTEVLLKILIPDITILTNCQDAFELPMKISNLGKFVERHHN